MTAILCALLAASSFAAPYENSDLGFRFTAPAGATTTVASPTEVDDFILRVDRPGEWQCLIRVAVVESGTTARSLREKAMTKIEAGSDFARASRRDGTLGEGKAPGVLADTVGPSAYRVDARITTRDRMRYIVQWMSPRATFDSHARIREQLFESFALQPIDADAFEKLRLRSLARRCASDLDWATNWDDAAERARREGKLILAVARFYQSFDISDSQSTATLSDEDVSTLVQERFVPLRVTSAAAVPFRDPALYGLSRTTLGAAFLVTTSDGKVIRETSAVHPVIVDEFLRDVLASSSNHDQPGDDLTPIQLAEWHFRRGELTKCRAKLDTLGTNPEALFLRARLLRRLRDADAVTALTAARPGADTDRFSDWLLEATRVHAGLGHVAEAAEFLDDFLAEASADDERYVEALARLGFYTIANGDPVAGEAFLQRATENPDSRWAWKAAAYLTSTARDLGAITDPRWPSEELVKATLILPRTATRPTPAATTSALEYLLQHQRADGTWVVPSETAKPPKGQEDPFVLAITAICAKSLLPYHNNPEVQRALARTLEHLRRSRAARQAENELVHYMDYWVWTKSYRLAFVVECLAAIERGADLGDRNELRRMAAELVNELAARQRGSGGWSYYLTRDLDSAERDTGSISFVTAAVTLTLVRAQEAGVELPAGMLDRAVACLESTRTAEGTISYHGGIGTAAARTSPRAGACRAPLGYLALHRVGRARVQEVREAVELFLRFKEDLAAEQGKTLMHAGAQGQGSHYVMFDYAMTAAAIQALPEVDRGKYAPELLELVGRGRASDGGYQDLPSLGRAYGTAMALEVFTALGLGLKPDGGTNGK